MKQYRIKEFQWAQKPAFTAEESDDGIIWQEVPLFPTCRTLDSARDQLRLWLKPAPEPIYHQYP